MRRWLPFLVYWLIAPPLVAAEWPVSSKSRESVNIGISTREIAIAPDFAGTDITIFGALDNADQYLLAIGAYDIVVTLEGPVDQVSVRRKENVFGLWINRASMSFLRAPQSYSIASTRTVDSIAPAMELYARNIGLTHLKLVPGGQESSPDAREFRTAFLRLKQSENLYQTNSGGVTFVSASLFRASIHLPAEIPNGEHTVRAYLFKAGEFIAQKELTLHVVKTGIEQIITQAAYDHPFAYGLFCVTLAMITGWLANLIFRRE